MFGSLALCEFENQVYWTWNGKVILNQNLIKPYFGKIILLIVVLSRFFQTWVNIGAQVDIPVGQILFMKQNHVVQQPGRLDLVLKELD